MGRIFEKRKHKIFKTAASNSKLYAKYGKRLYMAAKNAPDAITKLRDEFAILIGAINTLTEEIKTPDSIVNNTGHARKQMLEEPVRKISNTLLEL